VQEYELDMNLFFFTRLLPCAIAWLAAVLPNNNSISESCHCGLASSFLKSNSNLCFAVMLHKFKAIQILSSISLLFIDNVDGSVNASPLSETLEAIEYLG
jgi:hypothetical protein